MSLYPNRLVVKVGTSTLTNGLGQNDLRAFDRLACVLADIQNMGCEVVLGSAASCTGTTNFSATMTRSLPKSC